MQVSSSRSTLQGLIYSVIHCGLLKEKGMLLAIVLYCQLIL